ncbi:MAG: ATP-binding cassette domain-containing protein [Gammaproteobacteria bacterium]|jgi:ABC transport system ATP-binding/permease protein|nr:ATP-binding cassette domain-containing protein [Gammaproteobacteria bacterium]
MPLLTLNNVSLAYGHQPLLSDVNLRVSRNERVCLVGRNGTGKSTLFRLLSGEAQPDEGDIWYRDTLRISYLQQEVPEGIQNSIYEVVAAGLGDIGLYLSEYHNVIHHPEQKARHTLDELQQKIDVLDGWNISQKVETVLSRLSLPTEKMFADCSGGIRRRVMLARALVSNPDILLLDEPTNHMDIASITWLEEFLLGFQGALIFITHDRTLLRHLATRIIELDRGTLCSFPGDYDHYLDKKQKQLDAEERANAKFDKKLAEHEVWIRQGIKARRTRNEGRVRHLQDMRLERSQRISQQSKARLDLDKGEVSGKLVVELRDVSFNYDEHCIINNFSTRIMRGDRVGIIGPNGSGKSTLLKLLLAELKPVEGWVASGTKLQTAYFDQQRAQLDLEKTVRENISHGSDQVTIAGKSRHIVSYMKDFLFPPERINSPVKSLSGGERNRLLLARIFTLPANMLVLDEPTNDLDVETLELLEELLAEYDGTLLLVSHDRTFLDRVVTSTIVFEGEGNVNEYVGGYEDWVRQRPVSKTLNSPNLENTSREKPSKNEKQKHKLNYNEQQELKSLPASIKKLENLQQQLEVQIASNDFYKQDKENITKSLSELEKTTKELELAFERWDYLDSF